MFFRLDELYTKKSASLTIVHGDTTTALAGAIVAKRHRSKVAHIEAGCRSGNIWQIEEQNRKMISQIADFHFAPTKNCFNNLVEENVNGEIYDVGDVMYDLFLKKDYKKFETDSYLLTIHRAENVDQKYRLQNILNSMSGLPIIFPIHPRTKKMIEKFKTQIPKSITITEPFTYSEMRSWELSVKAVLTDSGGVQKEAYWSHTPVVIIREETEWKEIIDTGWGILGLDVKKALTKQSVGEWKELFGDGQAHKKIAIILKRFE
jgi:UDP-N-acetylglucosamine 2-epimerase